MPSTYFLLITYVKAEAKAKLPDKPGVTSVPSQAVREFRFARNSGNHTHFERARLHKKISGSFGGDCP